MNMFMLLALVPVNTPKPANFECDLVLVSTSRHIAEWDQNMAWMTTILEPEVSTVRIPSAQLEDARAALAAARELDIRKTPVVVMDGAAFKTSHYDVKRQKKLNILASLGDGKGHKGRQTHPYSMSVIDSRVTPLGSSYSGFHFGPQTTAKGPKPGPKEAWPTFCMLPIQEQIDATFVSHFSDERLAANRALALNFSTLSVSETAELIDKSAPNYEQICICAWGTQIPGRPNLIAFPPNGRAVRYKFGHKDGKWFANFVKAY